MADENKNKTEEKDDDFKYIVRIANTDLDGEKTAITALTSIKGVGPRIADNISDEDAARIEEVLVELYEHVPKWFLNRQKDWESGDDLHLLSTDLEMGLRDDINRLRMIRCYRGIRHESGHKVRGQKTRSNGRPGLTLGVSKRRPS